MSPPSRDEIDPEYRFDLTRIYETPADWETAREALADRLDDLDALAAEPPGFAADLRSLLAVTEECYRRKQRVELYARLARNVATNDDEADDRLRRFRDLESTFEPVVAAVRRALGAIDRDRFDAWLDEIDGGDVHDAADLDADDSVGWRRYAERLREAATHARSSEVEDAVAAFEDARTAPTRIVRAVTTEDFDPPAVEGPDGDSVEIRYGNYRTELSREDRDYRRRVYEAYRGEMDRFEHVLTRTYAEKLQVAAAEAELRGYDSALDRAFHGDAYPESGLTFELPVAVHDAMVDAVRDNLGPYHRAREVRRERLGVDDLRPWDLSVSIADADPPEISYEEAREHVLAALEPLGEDYVERVRTFFEGRRIDAFPTEDKRTDIPAYCPSSAADGAFVLANFREDVRTTFYVVHELGHAMNVAYHREGLTRYATCPRPVSEVPSILHELLLVEHFLDEGGALAEAARNRVLECLGGNFYGAAWGSAFAHRLVTAVEEGREVTPKRAREAWSDLQMVFEAPVVYDDRAGRNWLGRGIREVYSRYQYVLGATGALAARERLRDGDLAPAEYRQFLRSTGREDQLALFERLGCDVRTAGPYERAAEAFDGYVDAVAE